MAASVGAPRFEIRGISNAFGPTRAVTDISLAVDHGDVCAMVGHNGAVKSTLEKILAGFQPADAGEKAVDGRPMRFDSPADALSAQPYR